VTGLIWQANYETAAQHKSNSIPRTPPSRNNKGKATSGCSDRKAFYFKDLQTAFVILNYATSVAFPAFRWARNIECQALRCTAPQIMSISGHKNLKEVQTYIQAADRLGLAREALKRQIAADENRTGIVKPIGVV
jgi:hypothetical protein